MATAFLDPVLDALDRAPSGEEDLAAEELRELERRAAELTSGRVTGVSHGEVQRGLEGLVRKAG